MEYRFATIRDLPQLRQFEQGIVREERPMDATLAPDPIQYYDLESILQSDQSIVVVAMTDGNLVGCGLVQIRTAKPYVDHDEFAYLGMMFTDANYRGKGVNQGIVEKLKSWIVEKGITEIRLEVYAENTPAICAYEKAGFKPGLIEMRLSIPS